MRNKSVVNEAREIQIAVDLIELGARLQLLQEETGLSRERLLRLYKEVKGESPSKGMLPYSTDWFMSWLPNIHSSLFMGIHQYLTRNAGISGVEALIKSYRLYLEQVEVVDEPVLSITRAWFLIRFFDAGMLQLTECKECGGQFVVHSNELCANYSCGICRPPSRAGKTKKAAQAEAAVA
ncbi:flagellar transcriptional regulator FlhC [Sideroxyarcus emersonii]|uniref:Flagellar transcriptional regulator FlhC n=1 Tax=Sideroxyarcus emersonii TaxID=2764705 RepID=A0AAN2BY16_9PROT|nr:flagellar transcriptional regulator FlhC [Sideroxyarcus emersonii]BCK86664.1 flagellar transcriptional regulator FlhC [Sideroxyarcus emersonii]